MSERTCHRCGDPIDGPYVGLENDFREFHPECASMGIPPFTAADVRRLIREEIAQWMANQPRSES